ncbi:hypothetical protein SAMN05421730_101920 [Anaerobium acetethylicum]|uniref:DUF4830 domain-containing protein n=1 Tax=Anaerobium acetethylicum TaxID=1619234 RepID=A0A1D3TVY9_9FIRM|nr:hypothetical protein SAMN05421730_101920 [Anaerobium acetethylicum]
MIKNTDNLLKKKYIIILCVSLILMFLLLSIRSLSDKPTLTGEEKLVYNAFEYMKARSNVTCLDDIDTATIQIDDFDLSQKDNVFWDNRNNVPSDEQLEKFKIAIIGDSMNTHNFIVVVIDEDSHKCYGYIPVK